MAGGEVVSGGRFRLADGHKAFRRGGMNNSLNSRIIGSTPGWRVCATHGTHIAWLNPNNGVFGVPTASRSLSPSLSSCFVYFSSSKEWIKTPW